MTVRRALEGLKGGKKAEGSFSEKRATVTYDPGKGSVDDMVQAVGQAGFQALQVPKE